MALSKFLTVADRYVNGTHANETNALTAAEKACQPHGHAEVGIYRLVKIVRRKVTPVEIEEVACCE